MGLGPLRCSHLTSYVPNFFIRNSPPAEPLVKNVEIFLQKEKQNFSSIIVHARRVCVNNETSVRNFSWD